jgi:replicative DNA helicase
MTNDQSATNKKPKQEERQIVPPHAMDLEKAVLGAIMIEKETALNQSLVLKEEYFYRPEHQLIYQAIKNILDRKNSSVDILTVMEELKRMKKLEEVGGPVYLTQLSSTVATADNFTSHSSIIIDKYLLRRMIEIGHELEKKAYDASEDPLVLAEWASKQLMDVFEMDIHDRNSFKEALKHTITDIIQKSKGEVNPYIKTGDAKLDKEMSFRKGWLLVIAGEEGVGKSKFVIWLLRKMLDHEENKLAVLWYSMEDDRIQIIRSFISMDTGLTTKQLQSINYKITKDDIEKVDFAMNSFNDYHIEFVDKISSIDHIRMSAKRFGDKWNTKTKIIVIDNFGLIDVESSYRSVERDDYLMSKIKDIADEMEAFIIIVHHFNKEAAKRFNIRDGYRPRKEHIRGSNRILDYVQQALFVSLPRKHKDLVYEEKKKIVNLTEDIMDDYNKFLEKFWMLNPHGDKHTEQLTDVPKTTWNEFLFHIKHRKKLNGDPITSQFLVKKYSEYVAWIDDLNADRDKRYHKAKISIYGYLKNQMFNEDFSPDKTTRTFYLYGDNSILKSHLDELFIAESIKNRDGSNSEEQVIFRYIADLDTNRFIDTETYLKDNK